MSATESGSTEGKRVHTGDRRSESVRDRPGKGTRKRYKLKRGIEKGEESRRWQ